MSTDRICSGDSLTWLNETDTDIENNQTVVVGARFFKAMGNIPAGLAGELAATDVWWFPKINVEMPQGELCYWDADGDPEGGEEDSGAITLTAADGVGGGTVWQHAAAGDPRVAVKLG